MLRYLERSEPESGDLGDLGDVGDMGLVCDSLGLPMDGARELARDGGGRGSGEDLSSGEAMGGTMVASDLRLPDLFISVLGGGRCSCSFVSSFVPLSSASSVISINRRRRSELDEDVIDPDAVCRRHADDRALSLSSDAWDRASTVSFGVNLSRTDWN